MGQKVNPHGMRVGVIKDWDSKWYADAEFSDYLVEDYNIRKFLKKKLYSAGISKIEIESYGKKKENLKKNDCFILERFNRYHWQQQNGSP